MRPASDRTIDAIAGPQSPSAQRRLLPIWGERQVAAVAANVRTFAAPAANRKWIADFTYVCTAEVGSTWLR